MPTPARTRQAIPVIAPTVTSRISKDGDWHVWEVFVNGKLKRKGWTPSTYADAAREAAKDMRELSAMERTRADEGGMWCPEVVS